MEDAKEKSIIGYSERVEICKKCEHFLPRLSRCKKCGCFTKVKLRIKSSKCPINKW